MWSLRIFLAILGEKNLEGSRMEFMKLLHVVPAHPRACLVFLSWTSWHRRPPRYVNCLLHRYLPPKLLMIFPASKGSWALMSGIYNFCVYIYIYILFGRHSSKIFNSYRAKLSTVSSYVQDKRGRRINLLPSCNLGCLLQKQVVETTARVLMVQRAIQGHRFSLAPLHPILRWGVFYLFQYSSIALIDFISQASFFKNTWATSAVDFSSSLSCFLENHSVLPWHFLLSHGRGDQVTGVSFSCEHRWNLWLFGLYL